MMVSVIQYSLPPTSLHYCHQLPHGYSLLQKNIGWHNSLYEPLMLGKSWRVSQVHVNELLVL